MVPMLPPPSDFEEGKSVILNRGNDSHAYNKSKFLNSEIDSVYSLPMSVTTKKSNFTLLTLHA